MVSDLDGTWMVLGWFMAVYDVPYHVYSDCFLIVFHECVFWIVIIYQPFFSEECIPMFVGWNVLLLVIVCIILGFLNFCLWNSQCFFNVYWYSPICLLKKLLYKQQWSLSKSGVCWEPLIMFVSWVPIFAKDGQVPSDTSGKAAASC